MFATLPHADTKTWSAIDVGNNPSPSDASGVGTFNTITDTLVAFYQSYESTGAVWYWDTQGTYPMSVYFSVFAFFVVVLLVLSLLCRLLFALARVMTTSACFPQP